MRKLLFATIIVACAASYGWAQSKDDYNKYDIYAGYSHSWVDFGGDREGYNGFEVAATGNITRYVGLKGDYTLHFKTFNPGNVDSKIHNLVGGLQFKDNSTETKLKPFAHVMAGFVNARASGLGFSDSSTGFSGVIGGGLDVRAGKRIDIRVIQADYNPTHVEGSWQHSFRIGAGIVFR